MSNLLRGRDKLERKLNDKPSVVCIQYYRRIATGNGSEQVVIT